MVPRESWENLMSRVVLLEAKLELRNTQVRIRKSVLEKVEQIHSISKMLQYFVQTYEMTNTSVGSSHRNDFIQ